MQAVYIVRRFGVFLMIVWLAATLNFFLPRLSGQDPVRAKLLQQAADAYGRLEKTGAGPSVQRAKDRREEIADEIKELGAP